MANVERSACLTDEEVAAFVGGLLSRDERSGVERHIAECRACGELAAAAASGSMDRARSDDDAPLAHGARVGRYEIVDFLGAGAMGTVYAAHDPALDRKVALKLIRAQVAGPALEARLLREAKAMARLSHPEVITVHDAGRDGDRLFIAMELVDGGTLREWLRAAPRTWREILAVYQRAGRGLAQAHAAGIVHRDFKPDNVLIGSDGRVRVTDFGLARAERSPDAADEAATDERDQGDPSLTRTGALVGTPAYMAPEQLAGGVADVRSDVYSFSVALYEALYGERPFAGGSVAEMLAAKRAGDVRDAPAGAKVSPRLRRVLLDGLRARPEDRYATMTELSDALERAARAPRWPLAAAGVAIGAAAVVAWRAYAAPVVPPSAPVAASAPAASGCTSHRACVESHGGEPWICRAASKTCVPLASQDCTPRFEPNDLVNDDTVWLGAMFPLKGAAATEYGTMNLEGADLARQEIALATRGLEAPNASLHVPRVALVACDDSDDAMRAATHLVDDLGVPAIVGFGSGQKLADVAGSLLIPRGVLSIASLTLNPLVTRIPQPSDLPRMVWRTTYSFDAVATAIAHVIPELFEPRLARRRTRVTVVRTDTANMQSFAETLYKEISFNGTTATKNGGAYREVTIATGATDADVAGIATSVAEGDPTFVVLTGGEVMRSVVEIVEARWKAGTPRPTYLVANDSFALFAPFLGRHAERRKRLFVVESVSSATPNARFVIRYNERHAEKVTQTFNPSPSYDAFYVAAYAAFAAQGRAVTGAELARGIARLVPPGASVEAGPTHVFDALTRFAAGERVDLQGTASTLDFDLATGEVPIDFTLLCASLDADGGVKTEGIESGIVYRTSAKRVEGALRCP